MRKLAPLLLALLALGVAGCGGGAANGVAAKPVAQIIVDVKAAIARARSVRVVGSISGSGSQVGINLVLVTGVGAAGTLTENGLTARLVRLGSRFYLEAGPAFWHLYLGSNGRLLANRWIEAPVHGSPLAALEPFTTIPSLLDEMRILPANGLRKQRMTSVRGQRAFTLISATGGILYIAATGNPYPLELRPGADESGAISFRGWDRPYRIAAPRGAIPLARVTG